MSYKMILDQYAQTVYNKDVEGFMSIYDKNVHVFDTWNEWSYKNRDEFKAMVMDWFTSLGNEKVRVEFKEVNVFEAENQTVWVGELKFYGLSEKDEILRSISNRWTWVMNKDHEDYRIIHEHSSLPINTETFMGVMKKA